MEHKKLIHSHIQHGAKQIMESIKDNMSDIWVKGFSALYYQDIVICCIFLVFY